MYNILIYRGLKEKISNKELEEIIEYSYIIKEEMKTGNLEGRVEEIDSILRMDLESLRTLYFDYNDHTIKIIGIIKTKQKKARNKLKKKFIKLFKSSTDEDFDDITPIEEEITINEVVEDEVVEDEDKTNKDKVEDENKIVDENKTNKDKVEDEDKIVDKDETVDKLDKININEINNRVEKFKAIIKNLKSQNLDLESDIAILKERNRSLELRLISLEEKSNKMDNIIQEQSEILQRLEKDFKLQENSEFKNEISDNSNKENVLESNKENNLAIKKDGKVINITINV